MDTKFKEMKSLQRIYNGKKYHESLKIWPPPLRQTISNFPFVVDSMGDLIKLGTWRRSQTFIQPPLQAFCFILARLEVVSWTGSYEK